MFKKNDPLVGAVKGIMDKNEAQRKIVASVNEQFGVGSRRALTLEKRAEYDVALKAAMEGKPLTEEQLNEISKGKTGEYIKAAAADAARQGHKTELAVKQGKEEDAQKYIKKKYKRLDGINKAVNKLTKEDEQLNELSDTVVKSYEKKAMKSAKDSLRKADPKEVDHKTYNKRIKGLIAAKRKLAEDELLEEGAKASTIMAKYADNEDKNYHAHNRVLLAKHFGTPEEHADAKELFKQHMKRGSLPIGPLLDKVNKANDGHYKKLLAAKSAEQDAAAKALKPQGPGREAELKSRIAKVGAVAKFVKNSEKKGMSYPNQSRAWHPTVSTTHSDGEKDIKLKGTTSDTLDRAKKLSVRIKGELKNVKKQGTLPLKEGQEQLQEVSRKLLAKYVRKAHISGASAAGNAEFALSQGNQADLKKHNKTDEKRERGIDLATAKMAGDYLYRANDSKRLDAVKRLKVVAKEGYEHQYSKKEVDKAIKSSRKKIGGKEAKMIHALLKGRQKSDEPEKKKDLKENGGGLFGWGGFPRAAAASPVRPATPTAPAAARPVMNVPRVPVNTNGLGGVDRPATLVGSANAAGDGAPQLPSKPVPQAQAAPSTPPPAPESQPEVPASAATTGAPPAEKPVSQPPAAKMQARQNTAQRPTRPAARKPMPGPKRSFGFGQGGSGSQSAGAITNRALGGVNEEVTPIKVGKSLEKYLRNKYLK